MNKDKLRLDSLFLSELIEEESDFFPLLSQEDEDKIDFPVNDIVTLKIIFDQLREIPEYKEHLNSFILEPLYLDFILKVPSSSYKFD